MFNLHRLIRPAFSFSQPRRRRRFHVPHSAEIQVLETRSLLSAGSLDTSFGGGDGFETLDFGVSDFAGFNEAMVLDSQDRAIVVGGTNSGTTRNFAVARFTADGQPDLTFGSGGKVTIDFNLTGLESANGVAVLPDDGIVVVGRTVGAMGTGQDFAVAKLDKFGQLDLSFGTGGKVETNFAGFIDMAFDVEIDSAGRILVAGWAQRTSSFSSFGMGVVRYDTFGNLDPTFGSGGKTIVNFDSPSGTMRTALAYDMELTSINGEEKIVLSGHGVIEPLGRDFLLARLNSDGSLDGTFGGAQGLSGRVVTDLATPAWPKTFGCALAIAIDHDNRIVAAGYHHTFDTSPSPLLGGDRHGL
jgi:uncharacterized delta-60 repeat protein